ncbi:MAG TPA: hypothetical protein VF039_00750 [Longimicrobiales bacterium]
MRRIVAVVLLLALVVGAWLFRSQLIGAWQGLRGGDEPELASPELAERAEAKLASLNEADAPARVALTSAELQSLVTYRMAPSLPSFILDPVVTVEEGDLRVTARVPTDQVAGVRGIGGSEEILSMLPDTTEVQAKAHLIPLGDGRVGLAVDEVSAASIPLPSRAIPRILESVGRDDEPDLPAEALAVNLPAGVASAYTRGDSIVFVSRRSAN